MSFPDADHGWAVGTVGCTKAGAKCQPLIIASTDGGKTWQEFADPGGPNVEIGRLTFTDDTHGYLITDSTLETTTNGGLSWATTAALPGIPAGTDNAANIVGGSSAAGTYVITEKPTLYYEAPGAASFAPVTLAAGINPEAISVVGNTAFLTAPSVGSPSSGVTLRAVSGTATSTPQPTRQLCEILGASSTTAFLLVCGGGAGGGGMGTRSLYGTTDSGKTLTKLPNPGGGAGYDTGGVIDFGNSHAVIATSSSPAASLISTADGAQTWHATLSLASSDGATFSDLQKLDTNDAVVLGNVGSMSGNQGQIYRTADSGQTWTKVSL